MLRKRLCGLCLLLISKSATANNNEQALNGIIKSLETTIINKDKSNSEKENGQLVNTGNG
jgi:hypothetical protein